MAHPTDDLSGGRRPDAAVGALSQFDSVRLFLDRAQQVRPGFTVDDSNAPAIAAICSRLDGVPLAIELAAARCRSMSPAQIFDGLTDVFRLLTGSPRGVLPRQATLEASITWSHDLLTEPERVMFRRLSVFTGGCTLDAAEAVCSDDDQVPALSVLDLLDRLVSQSLVVLDDRCEPPRYRLLDTVSQYGARRLDESGETDAVRDRHLDFCLVGLSAIAPSFAVMMAFPEPAVMRSLSWERDNVLRVLDHAAAAVGGATMRFWRTPPASGSELSVRTKPLPFSKGSPRGSFLIERCGPS